MNIGAAHRIGSLLICVVSTAGLSVPAWSWAQATQSRACASTSRLAQVFAPTLADYGKIFRGAIGPDHQEFFFFKKVTSDPRAEDYRIFVSRLHDGSWSEPEQLTLGEEYSDLYPTLSSDGQRLVFTSYRPMPGDTSSHPNASLWYADRRGSAWGRPVPIHAATRLGSYHSQPAFRGDSLVFRRTSPDWRTTQTLVSRWDGHAYQTPTTFDPVEQWANWRPGFRVWGGIPGHDGAYAVLEISKLDQRTGEPLPSDLWATVRTGRGWTEPSPMAGGVNRAASTDNFPMVSEDGCNMVFVRDFSTFYQVSLQSALRQHTHAKRQRAVTPARRRLNTHLRP